MEYSQIKSAEELPEVLGINALALKRWFKNYPFGCHSDNCDILGKILVGKPVISAFLGISVKTLKRWFVKYTDIPITRTSYRCYALTNNLMAWKVLMELNKLPQSCFDAAQARMISKLASYYGLTEKHYIEYYVKGPYAPNKSIRNIRMRRTRHYRKTVDKTLKLYFLSRSLLGQNVDNSRLEKICFLPPPGEFIKNKI